MTYRSLILTIATFIATAAFAQNRIGSGAVDELYQKNCASCHGQKLEGGQGSSLIDDIWKYGSTDHDIAKVIRDGVPELGMVPWKGALTEEQIRSLVIYIREQNQLADKEAIWQRLKPEGGIFKTEHHAFKLEELGKGEGILWAIEFLPDGSHLVTQRDGILWHFKDGKRSKIEGIPEVWQHGQGGLLEVQRHPNYEKNGWIYLGYSENVGAIDRDKPAGMTCVVRGRIKDGKWVDQQEIFHVPPQFHSSGGGHYGTRFVFKDGYLFFGIGDRNREPGVQDLTQPNGKIHRIFDDGRIPEDNPFVATTGAYKSVWSFGHRNPQGLDMHPETGDIWEVEHGPRGGDEVNLIVKAQNYGWPVITYGMNYNGTPKTDKTHQEGMLQPKHYWNPSIAICGIEFYEGDQFPHWKNDLFVTGMASQELHRLVIEDGEVVHNEIVMKNQGRLRDVHSGPDGNIYVLLNSGSPRIGSVHRLVPADT